MGEVDWRPPLAPPAQGGEADLPHTLAEALGEPLVSAPQAARSRRGRRIDVAIAEPFRKVLSAVWLKTVATEALQSALPEGEAGQLSLVVTDDDTLRVLNREFRGLDEVTDVLSFSPSHPGHWKGEAQAPREGFSTTIDTELSPFVLPPGEPPVVGEVVISYPQAQRQAQDRHHTADRELALLIVHGVLHLVGHDHVGPQEAARMQAMERDALSVVFRSQDGE